MSDYSALQALIDAYITQNGNNEITGQIMNSVLNAIVDKMGTVEDSTLAEITEEIERAETAEEALAAVITTITSTYATTEALQDEASARSDADETLQTNIDAEASARSAADTSLQTEIADKADDSDVVHLAGTETITGKKNFTAKVIHDGQLVACQGVIIGDDQMPTIKESSTTTGGITLSNHGETEVTIENVATPTADTDAANKAYVDAVASDLDTLETTVSGHTTDITANATAITAEASARASADSAIQSDLDTLEETVASKVSSITVGTTTTGDAGTDASVSNSGTSTDIVLDFTIPQGATGATGATGAAGADGDDGVGIASVEQTTTSTASSGANVITVTKTDGTTSTFTVHNGAAGATGAQGNSGYTGASDELEVVNNLYDGGETAALSAEQGKVLNESLLNLTVDGPNLADTTVYGPSTSTSNVFFFYSDVTLRKVVGVTLLGTGSVTYIYRVLISDSTATLTLVTSATVADGETETIPVDLELGENEYIGITGGLYFVGTGSDRGYPNNGLVKVSTLAVSSTNTLAYYNVIFAEEKLDAIEELQEEIEPTTTDGPDLTTSTSSLTSLATASNVFFFYPTTSLKTVKSVSVLTSGKGYTYIYKVSISDTTATTTLLASFVGHVGTVRTVDLDITLGDDEYIGVTGSTYYATGSDYGFSSLGTVSASGGTVSSSTALLFYNVTYTEGSKLENIKTFDTDTKSIVLFGDSITYGYSPNGQVTYYEEQVAEKWGTDDVTKQGYPGACVAQSGSNNYLSTSDRTNAVISAAPDVVLALVGVNDYQVSSEIGDITDTDVSTFYGAMKYIIETLMTGLPDCRLIFCTPTPYYYHLTGSTTYFSGREANSAGYTLRDYCDAIIKVCQLYSVAYVDSNCEVGWYDANEYTTKTYTSDGLHLSEAGYDRLTSLQLAKGMQLFCK